jgi:hypothetical protein
MVNLAGPLQMHGRSLLCPCFKTPDENILPFWVTPALVGKLIWNDVVLYLLYTQSLRKAERPSTPWRFRLNG